MDNLHISFELKTFKKGILFRKYNAQLSREKLILFYV